MGLHLGECTDPYSTARVEIDAGVRRALALFIRRATHAHIGMHGWGGHISEHALFMFAFLFYMLSAERKAGRSISAVGRDSGIASQVSPGHVEE